MRRSYIELCFLLCEESGFDCIRAWMDPMMTLNLKESIEVRSEFINDVEFVISSKHGRNLKIV